VSEVSGPGKLTFTVWPVYMGAATDEPGDEWIPIYEPYDDLHYSRGLIDWEWQPDGNILGRARIFVPKGAYTHLLFCLGPHAHGAIGNQKLEQPMLYAGPGVLDVWPISNRTYLPLPS
jgi:hypothetical protein